MNGFEFGISEEAYLIRIQDDVLLTLKRSASQRFHSGDIDMRQLLKEWKEAQEYYDKCCEQIRNGCNR